MHSLRYFDRRLMKHLLLIIPIFIFLLSCNKHDQQTVTVPVHDSTQAEKHIGNYIGIQERGSEGSADTSFTGVVNVSLPKPDSIFITGFYFHQDKQYYPVNYTIDTDVFNHEVYDPYLSFRGDSMFYYQHIVVGGVFGRIDFAAFRGKKQ